MIDINIVLIEPEIPQNTGNIVRTCAVTGAKLHLVKPMGFEFDDAKLKRAGLDYWREMEIYFYENSDEFFEKNAGEKMYFFTKKAPKSFSEIDYPERVFLVFGKETKGLDEKLLSSHLDSCVRIPMRNNLRCLNLSNSAAIAVYEVLRQKGYPGMKMTEDILG